MSNYDRLITDSIPETIKDLKMTPLRSRDPEALDVVSDGRNHLSYKLANGSPIHSEDLLKAWMNGKYGQAASVYYVNNNYAGTSSQHLSVHHTLIHNLTWFMLDWYHFLDTLELRGVSKRLSDELRKVKLEYTNRGDTGRRYSMHNIDNAWRITIDEIPEFCAGLFVSNHISLSHPEYILPLIGVFLKTSNTLTTAPSLFFSHKEGRYPELKKSFNMVETVVGRNRNSQSIVSQYFIHTDNLTIDNLLKVLPKEEVITEVNKNAGLNKDVEMIDLRGARIEDFGVHLVESEAPVPVPPDDSENVTNPTLLRNRRLGHQAMVAELYRNAARQNPQTFNWHVQPRHGRR